MKTIKKILSYSMMLLLVLTINPINSMDSISGAARAARKKEKQLRKRIAQAIANVMTGLATQEDIQQIDQTDFNVYLLPAEIKTLLLSYMPLCSSADNLYEALQIIVNLSRTSKELHFLIYNDPNVYIPMIDNLAKRFKDHPVVIAEKLNHEAARKHIEKLVFEFY